MQIIARIFIFIFIFVFIFDRRVWTKFLDSQWSVEIEGPG